jgi:hypothetical protein
VNKGNPRSHAPGPGRLIHHPHPTPAQVRNRLVDIGDFHRDVVQRRSPPVKEPGDGPRSGRLKQLEIGVPGRKHTLNETRGVLSVRALESEQIANNAGRAISPVREGNMVKPGHPPGAARFRQRSPSCAARARYLLRNMLFYM